MERNKAVIYLASFCLVVALSLAAALTPAQVESLKRWGGALTLSDDDGHTERISVTTVSWVATAYLGPRNDPKVLAGFFEKVHPGTEDFRLALVGWVSGCLMIWSALFTVGNILYGRYNYALALAVVFAISGSMVIGVVRRLWN